VKKKEVEDAVYRALFRFFLPLLVGFIVGQIIIEMLS